MVNSMDNDTISRKAAIEAITDERIVTNMDSVYDSDLHRCKRAMHRILASLPSAERRGRWIEEYSANHFQAKCSACGESTLYGITYDLEGNAYYMNYCPNCGAKMDDNWEEPAINPCRGCEDYDGRGGCISKGGCEARMEGEEK